MGWSALDDGFHDHPKVVALIDQGADGLAAIGLWTLARTWTARHRTGGQISEQSAAKLIGKRAQSVRKLAGKLVEVGLFDVAFDGWKLHDSEQYDRRELREKRAEAGRLGARKRWASERGSDGNSHPEPIATGIANAIPPDDGKAWQVPSDSKMAAPARALAPSQPNPLGSTYDDDVRTSTTPGSDPPEPSSSSGIDPRLAKLADAITARIGPGTDWRSHHVHFGQIVRDRIAGWIDRHGVDALVELAERFQAGRRPPTYPSVWIGAWATLDQAKTRPAPPPRCSVHDLAFVGGTCPSCRADQLAGSDDRPAPTPTGPPPNAADAIAAAKAALGPPPPAPDVASDPGPSSEVEERQVDATWDPAREVF